MATKSETNYYGLIGTGHLRARRPDVRFNTVFLGKIIDGKGVGEVITNATRADATKDWSPHKRAMEAFQEEVVSKKPKLDDVAKQVCDDLMGWRADHPSEWTLLEEVAVAHAEGQKLAISLKRKAEFEAGSARKAEVEAHIDALIAIVKTGASDDEIRRMKMRVMAAL